MNKQITSLVVIRAMGRKWAERKGQRVSQRGCGCYFTPACEGKKFSLFCDCWSDPRPAREKPSRYLGSKQRKQSRSLNQEAAGAECQRGGEKGKSYRISQVNIRTLDLLLSDWEAHGGFCRAEQWCYVTCIFKGITVAAVLNIDSRELGEETEGPERKQLQ